MSPMLIQKMSPIPTFPIELRIKAGRIPVRWEVRETEGLEIRGTEGKVISKRKTERIFWPRVVETKWGDVKVREIDNPVDLRQELFRLANTNKSEEAALRFLNAVGAWRLSNYGDPAIDVWARGTFASGVVFGHREILRVRVEPVTLAELLSDTEHWYRLLSSLRRNPVVIKSAFKPPSPNSHHNERFLFAIESAALNTLPLSLEWHGKDPYVVVETLCAQELLVAAAWADVASRAEPQVCDRCKTRFTYPRKKKYCLGNCAHLVAQRDYKRRKADEKRKAK